MSSRQRADELLSLTQSFFREHLDRSQGVSAHTVRAYRDALRLFFTFLAKREGLPVAALRLTHFDVHAAKDFLLHLEAQRANSIATRNCRLTALRSFFAHLVRHDLTRAAQYQQVLSLPMKRTTIAPAGYLEPEEMAVILRQPDCRSSLGLRDRALLLFIYNTGARISEALAVRLQDLSLTRPRQVRLYGKGKKERLCPLWKETTAAIQQFLKRAQRPQDGPIFRNRFGEPLTRDGAADLLRKYTALAARDLPALRRRRVTPHLLRHSCAVALLQAGNDLTVIRDYLGHSSIATTNRYLSCNLQMKREALDRFWRRAGLHPARAAEWKPKPDLLAFLSSL
jgi:site-specific recombinase XerD